MLERYIKLLKKEHIVKYASNLGYSLNDVEINFIYDKIKYQYKELINNPDNIFKEAKQVLRGDVYSEIINLYQIYKKKLGHYL